jgi:outer membrane protein OmpA-like peptidoglycan-associated protein
MTAIFKSTTVLLPIAMLAGTVPATLAAQPQDTPDEGVTGSVTDTSAPPPAQLAEGPQVEGIISARHGDRMQVTTVGGTKTVVAITDATRIKSSGGFLGLSHGKLAADSLLNGLPVSVRTWQSGDGLIARQIDLKSKDLRTAAMIRNGTDQRFGEQAAATEALRGRMADIDNYNIKSTLNVNFQTGKAVLSDEAKNQLCATAGQAESMNNALLLVVGYTDSTGSADFNQRLSEKRAGNVVNYLQQACHWKPYRMLTPTGMSEADPVASNETTDGKAQNRRVAVNIMVSKGLDGM